MTLEDLKRVAASVGERRGWDFSRMSADRDPVPWDYADVVRRYLQPSSRVLDIGTGGGCTVSRRGTSLWHRREH